VPTESYEHVDDDEVLDVTELPDTGIPGPRLRMLVLEAAPHLAAARRDRRAGHAVVIGSPVAMASEAEVRVRRRRHCWSPA